PVAEAAGYGVELLDAVITLRRHVPTAGSAVVGSALVGTDGRIRVTRFSRPPADAGRLDAAVVGTAETLRDLLSGSAPPPTLAATAAVNQVRDAGFVPKTVGGASDTVAEGTVISTSPPGGAKADEGSTVTITVSKGAGEVSVPAVVGSSREDAITVLTQAGLR